MVDRFVYILKWPVGLIAIALLPGVVVALSDLIRQIMNHPAPMEAFGLGVGLYLVAWYFIFRTALAGSFFSTFEHEFTHAIFAWLTLHRVRGLKATWSRGGHMVFEGKGNWLIHVAPYYFPTLAIPVVVYLYLFAGTAPQWVDTLLGATVAYHITSTWRETHWGQSDLQEVGFVFAFSFLPAANLACLGALLAFAHDGYVASYGFLTSAFVQSEGIWQGILNS